jgi:lactoylglutathione lyase
MLIEHVAIWTKDLDRLALFHRTYFQAEPGARYVSAHRPFESLFLMFEAGARLELMQTEPLSQPLADKTRERRGYAHLAFSVGSRDKVDALTARLQADGYTVVDGPRWTGDE